MTTHVIKDDGTVTVIEGKVKELKEMQALVKGPIEIVNAAMPAASEDLPAAVALKEMVVNEEGLFNNSFKTNEKAQKLYLRLGFIIEEESDTHIKMIYKKLGNTH